jgi:hypothetical protein
MEISILLSQFSQAPGFTPGFWWGPCWFNATSNNVSVILRQSVLLVEETTFCSSLNIKVRENRRGNKEWTIQRNWQHWAHKTQYENEQNTTQKTKKMSNTDPMLVIINLLIDFA